MRGAPPIRPQRAPIFIGCEGLSEMGYAGWLRNIVRDRDLPFHLELSDLGRGAGDPLTRIDLAMDRIRRMEGNREPFIGRFLFLDTDQLVTKSAREQARRRADDDDITVIWQDPTHEAFLLRHFPARVTHRPPTKQAADTALAKEWVGYEKPCTAQQIESKLELAGAHRVAGNLPELAALLRTIQLLDG